MASADVLLHPVRLRIVQAFLGDRVLTTSDLRAELPDVPAATLYRHVGVLAQAGLLVVAGERKVRGAAERSYRLRVEAANVGPDEAAQMSPDEHRSGFTAFVAALLADFDRYLERAEGTPDLGRDGAGYRQVGLWMDDEEYARFLADLRAVLLERMANEPGNGRRRRVVTTVLMPGDGAAVS